ncbi:MAG: hypothetical protein NWE94_03800 [Candidatus Bathyarchaeota archaeon]|nr:hypothetical protein [Candidatus Bathyarchaeota archaeon]
MKNRVFAVVFILALSLLAGVLLSFILASAIPFATASSVFYRTYGGTEMKLSKAYDVVQTADGGYAIGGIIEPFSGGDRNFWLVKTDSAGNMDWNRTIGGSKDDFAYSVVQTADGGYTMGGYTNSFGAGGYDFWLVKTDAIGNLLWNRTYGTSGNEKAYSMTQTRDGGYVLTGSDFWLVKTDPAGNMEWNQTHGPKKVGDFATSVVQTADGGYALTGGSDAWLIKTDSTGNMEWNKTYGDLEGGNPEAIVQTNDGGYAIAGTKSSSFWLAKTDSAGNIEWTKTYTLSTVGDWCQSMIQTKDGGYTLAGTKGYTTMILLKTDSSGNIAWNKTYGYGSANAVIQTSDDGYALSGYNSEQGYPTFCLVKTDDTGVIPEIPQSLIAPLVIAATLTIIAAAAATRNKTKLHTTH